MARGLTQRGHPGPRTCARMSRGSPKTVLRRGTVQRVCQLIFSFEIRIHAGYFKLGLELGSGGGVHYGSSGL